tara:strand:- start:14545 stop:14853 length:309 start_codon:yes stop_codon:yes gene_type:complete
MPQVAIPKPKTFPGPSLFRVMRAPNPAAITPPTMAKKLGLTQCDLGSANTTIGKKVTNQVGTNTMEPPRNKYTGNMKRSPGGGLLRTLVIASMRRMNGMKAV